LAEGSCGRQGSIKKQVKKNPERHRCGPPEEKYGQIITLKGTEGEKKKKMGKNDIVKSVAWWSKNSGIRWKEIPYQKKGTTFSWEEESIGLVTGKDRTIIDFGKVRVHDYRPSFRRGREEIRRLHLGAGTASWEEASVDGGFMNRV